MRGIRRVVWGAVALLVACATPSPPDEPDVAVGSAYSCNEILLTPLGEFSAQERRLSWRNARDGWRSHPDSVPRISLTYPILLDPFQPGERVDTFTGLSDGPELWVFFDKRFERWVSRTEREPRFLEARIGEAVLREDLRGASSGWVTGDHVAELMRHEGDLELALLDGGGAVLRRARASRETLLAVEDTLRDLQARVIANLADEEHRCVLVQEVVII